MSKIDKKDLSIIIDEVIDKLKIVRQFKDELRKANEGFEKLIEYGFFDAFLNVRFLSTIIKRLDECKQEKETLALYLANDFGGNIESFFIESGSTLAYFAKALYDKSKKTELSYKQKVITNNFFVQTLLLEVFPELRVTSGFLRRDYLAYVPFAAEDQVNECRNEIPKLDALRSADRATYSRLDNIISMSDVIYMTASTFGLLVGPSTRSRDNAIFKYCLLNNTARRPIRFCITEPKVFRMRKVRKGGRRYKWDPMDKESKLSLSTHFEKCCFIFDLRLPCDSEENSCTQRSKIDIKGIVETAIDGISCYEHLLCRGKHSNCVKITKWHNKNVKINFRSVPSELGLIYKNGFMENSPVLGGYDTWLSYLNGQPRGNVEIIIGCESQQFVSEMIQVVNEANQFIEAIGYTYKYNIIESNNNIVHLKVL